MIPELSRVTESHSPMRILLLDDDPIVRMVVEKLLCKKGYLVVCTKSGEEVISTYKNALATGNMFFIVLIDLTISEGMGGVETAQIIKQLDPSSKTVIFTGYSNDPIVEDYKKFSFDGVLKKPFSLEEFEILVNTFV